MARPKGKAQVEKRNQQLERLSVEYVDIDSITANEYNPNRQNEHDFELLLRSMREDGFTQPIIAIREARTIVDGEHRWRAAHTLGYKQVPVVFVDMTPEQARIATLRHNRARGSEDLQLAAEVLRDLEKLGALDWAQDSLMLDDTELQRLLEDIPAPEALAAEDWGEAWEPRDETSVIGDGEEDLTDETKETSDGGVAAASAAAVEAMRQRERAIARARNAEERAAAQAERRNLFRVSLVFVGEEADLVRSVLGERAAETLVKILREWSDGDKG